MDVLIEELEIPKKQIKETKTANRFQVIVHTSWLKCLSKYGKVIDFPIYNEFIDDWDTTTKKTTTGIDGGKKLCYSWTKIYISVLKKYTHKVIPLPRCRNEQIDSETPLSYSQLLHYVSQSNHKNLWKNAYKKYVSSQHQITIAGTSNLGNPQESPKKHEKSINLIPYDIILREAIVRMYGCHIVHAKLDKVKDGDQQALLGHINNRETDVNLYPVVCAIETNSYIFIIYDVCIPNTLNDCITYSPAVLEKSHNKPLFLIYQLFNLMKALHDRGLLLGDIDLNDIYLTENLWLQIIPRIESNILQLEGELHENQLDFIATSSPTKIKPYRSSSVYATTSKYYLPPEIHLSYSLKDYCEMWCQGQLSNFDYLTILNRLSGRRVGCPEYHPIMPWVTDFKFRNGNNWRDLTKSKYRLNKGDPQLDLTFQPANGNDIPHHVSDVLSEITYYVYMARRTPKIILRKHVRPVWVPAEYPASIQRLQEWSPDECIPEFFSDALVFKSIHEDLPDLEVPVWSSCPEDFITKHREALESQYVSERLHNWIDLTFGYKLSGPAAVKAKNVCLSFVDDHKNLCQRGVVQLFENPHPPKLFPTVWMSKSPPRIYSHNEPRRRLTRSSEDLSIHNYVSPEMPDTVDSQSTTINRRLDSSPRTLIQTSFLSEDGASIMERSTSYHVNVQKSPNVISLPKDYNPAAQLVGVENMEIFMGKTFYHSVTRNNGKTDDKVQPKMDVKINPTASNYNFYHEDADNAFTNRIFSETYEASLMKDNKRLHNLKHKNFIVQNSTRNFKQIVSEYRFRELQIIGCIIVELFLPGKLRPHSNNTIPLTFEERLETCLAVLKYEMSTLPKCVQYPVRLLLQIDTSNGNIPRRCPVTDKGLPNPSAHQILQPLLNNALFPFPLHYMKIYTLIKSLMQFNSACRLLDLHTFFECDGKNCEKFESFDKTRIAFHRKIAECKVKACVTQIESLLEPIGYEQFNSVELLLPHVTELITNDDTSILAAWYLFDPLATALGSKNTQKYLLGPILHLYDADNDERTMFLISNFDSSMKFTTSAAFKSKKSVKLYHHSFLLRLVVRFGLKCFLDNFIAPLIEAVGGYKEPENNLPYHYHDNSNSAAFRKSRSTKNLKYCNDNEQKSQDQSSNVLVSPDVSDRSSDKTSPSSIIDHKFVPSSSSTKESQSNPDNDGLFDFEEHEQEDEEVKVAASKSTNLDDSGEYDAEKAIMKIIDQFDFKSETLTLDLQLNHSQAEEVTEDTQIIIEDQIRISDFVYNLSLDDDRISCKSIESLQKSPTSTEAQQQQQELKSPTIPIPHSVRRSDQVNSIGCEIGSRKSIDSADINTSAQSNKDEQDNSDASAKTSVLCRTRSVDSKSSRSNRISEMSSESLIWLSHRLGPVLSSRYLSRNLLKMLTLCYVGQENLLPDTDECDNNNLNTFSITDGRVVGDQNATKVLECLTSIAALFGDQLILLQYFPHVSELIALCKKRITPSLEGALISSLQLLKYLVPCLSDNTIMDQLHDIILRCIIHPIIRILGSSRCLMPGGFLARSVMARKLLDAIYVLAIRIGPEMTREHLCVPALQRFFLIFDKAFGISDHFRNTKGNDEKVRLESSPANSDDLYIELRRDGGVREWTLKGSPLQFSIAQIKGENSFDSFTSPPQLAPLSTATSSQSLRVKALEEIKEVFTPNLAHSSYVPFLSYLGETIMQQTVKNLPLVLNLCYEYEQPDYLNSVQNKGKFESNRNGDPSVRLDESLDGIHSNSFGTSVIGNRIEVKNERATTEMGPMELLNLVTYKMEQINTARHLRGNWLAYWEHEIGRADKDNHLNLKQIKLQSYTGHTNSIRGILCLDNENSFMSASKDKTVKLWSLRSEGDGSKVSSCQFTYTNHRKSVHSLSFLESLRLAVSCDSGVHLWDPFVGAQIGQLDAVRHSPVSVVKTYPAPSALVLAGTAESTVKIIDARTFSYVNEWKLSQTINGSVRCIAVSPSGSWIAIGLSSGQLTLLDGRTGLILATWRANDGELLQLVAPNEQQLISSSLDHSISIWNALDGSLLYHLNSPAEPTHCLFYNSPELISGTPANKICVHTSITSDATYSVTKLRSETLKGVLTSISVLPLNRMLLVGSDSGNITLLC